MNDTATADESVVENDQGAEPELSLDPHVMGKTLPQGDSEEKPASEDDEVKDSDSPSDGEDNADKQPDESDADQADEKSEADIRKALGKLAYENRQLKRQLEQRQEVAPEGDADSKPLKTLKDFDYDEQAFNSYLVEEISERAAQKQERRQHMSKAEEAAQKAADEFAAREDAFEAENPGFKERLHADDLRITQEMAMFITDPESEVGLHVGDYLSRNPEEATKIASMNPTAQVREMTKLEARIGKEVAKAQSAKSKTSKAPAPPKPVDGTDPGVKVAPTDPKSDKMSDAEWLKAREKQLAAR